MFRELLARADWRRDAVLWGRRLAIAIALFGTLYAAMEAWSSDRIDDLTRVRIFISVLLGPLWYSTLILVVTEVFARLRDEEAQSNQNVSDVVRVVAGAIIVAALVLSIWSVVEERDDLELSVGEAIRYVVSGMLRGYLWQGGLLFLLASLVDRIGWRDDNELPEEEEGSLVVTEP